MTLHGKLSKFPETTNLSRTERWSVVNHQFSSAQSTDDQGWTDPQSCARKRYRSLKKNVT